MFKRFKNILKCFS